MLMRSLALLATLGTAAGFNARPVALPASRARLATPALVAPVMSAAADDFVPDMQRRTIMNLVLLGAAGVPVL